MPRVQLQQSAGRGRENPFGLSVIIQGITMKNDHASKPPPDYYTNAPIGPAWSRCEELCRLLTKGTLDDGSAVIIPVFLGDEFSNIDAITNEYGSYLGANVIYSDRNARYHMTIDTAHQQVRCKIAGESASLNYIKDRWGLNDFIKNQYYSQKSLDVDDFYEEHIAF